MEITEWEWNYLLENGMTDEEEYLYTLKLKREIKNGR